MKYSFIVFLLLSFIKLSANDQYIQLMAFNKIKTEDLNSLLQTFTFEQQNKIIIDKRESVYSLKFKNPNENDLIKMKSIFPEYFFTYLISNKAYQYNKIVGFKEINNDNQKSSINIKKIPLNILKNNINDNFKNKDNLKNYYIKCYEDSIVKNGRNIIIPERCNSFSFPFLSDNNEFFNVGVANKFKIDLINKNLENTNIKEKDNNINNLLMSKNDFPKIQLPQEVFINEKTNQNKFEELSSKTEERKIYPIANTKIKEFENHKILQPIIVNNIKEKDNDKIEELEFLTKRTFLIGLFSGFTIILIFYIYKDKILHNEKNKNEVNKKITEKEEILIEINSENKKIFQIIKLNCINLINKIKELILRFPKENITSYVKNIFNNLISKIKEEKELKEKVTKEIKKEEKELKEKVIKEDRTEVVKERQGKDSETIKRDKENRIKIQNDLNNLKKYCKITESKVEGLKIFEKESIKEAKEYKILLKN